MISYQNIMTGRGGNAEYKFRGYQEMFIPSVRLVDIRVERRIFVRWLLQSQLLIVIS